jgi:hypothetical protein
METPTITNGQPVKADLVKDAINAPIKASNEKLNTATKALKDANASLKEPVAELETVTQRIEQSKIAIAGLMEVKKSFNKVNGSANFASALGADVSGANVAQSITDAAKSVKTALGTVKSAYADAIAMNGRVQHVDVVDTPDTKKLVTSYMDSTMAAVELTQSWKDTSVELAVDNSSFLKLNVDDNVARITDLTAKVAALGLDVDSTIADRQALLEQDTSTAGELQAKIDALNIEIEKNGLAISTSKEIIKNDGEIDSGSENSGKGNSKSSKNSGKSKKSK